MNSTLSPVSFALLSLLAAAELAVLYRLLGDLPTQLKVGEEQHANRIMRNPIIVQLTDAATLPEVVEVACRFAPDLQAEILLVAEEKAKCLLEAGEGIVKQHNLKVETQVLHNGAAAEAILELARKTRAEAIVTGTGAPLWWSTARIERASGTLPRHVPYQIIVAKAPQPV
jgi:K+-sensing histidine kinase KdpD